MRASCPERFWPTVIASSACWAKAGWARSIALTILKLAQPVALKFLPDHLLSDSAALARFHREVRVARQVSHKNVCRVYDIGEVDGRHFLSMEFIKGEELSSLLRRIGRLPQDKALQLARQICAGLAAAHDVGFLHRDLKPANIMIDGDGNARILDFGLGGLTEEFGEEEIRAGTPAYMSPEQIEGREQTVQSDIYSLGLVLYELFTGKRAFDAPSLNELIKLRRSNATPTTPTSLVKDLDPLVERIIERCTRKDPEQRTIVSVAGRCGFARWRSCWRRHWRRAKHLHRKWWRRRRWKARSNLPWRSASLQRFWCCSPVACWLTKYGVVYRLTPLNQSPEVLRARAHDVIRRLGYSNAPIDSADGFVFRQDYLRYIGEQDQSARRWDKLRTESPGPYRFWYRDSPRYFDTSAEIAVDTPALDVSGMNSLYLDLDGRLHWFMHVPPQREPPAGATNAVDWSSLFREAGLDIATFQKATSTWVPLHAYDERAAWDGVDPLRPEQKVHVEAASFRGKPIYFETVYPWDQPARQEQTPEAGSERVFISAIIAHFYDRADWQRAGRAPQSAFGPRRCLRRRAHRFCVLCGALTCLGYLRRITTARSQGEFLLLLTYLSLATFTAFYLWLLYIALEPFVRRRWPHRIISWSRLLRGEFRDPLVGRHILIGSACGALVVALTTLSPAVMRWLGIPFDLTSNPGAALLGSHFFVRFSAQLTAGLFVPFMMFFLLLLFVTIVRNEWVSVGLLWIVVVLLNTLVSGNGLKLLPLTGVECRDFDRSFFTATACWRLQRRCSSCISGFSTQSRQSCARGMPSILSSAHCSAWGWQAGPLYQPGRTKIICRQPAR